MLISVANTDDEIAECFSVMSELRPHLSQESFVPLIRHLGVSTGLTLAYVRIASEIKAVAGYRISEWLAGGKYLEIEDLVSKETDRSKGHGSALFDWLVDLAITHRCRHLRLVSNVRRQDAHRFYLKKGMSIDAHYFSMNVLPTSDPIGSNLNVSDLFPETGNH